VEEHREMTAGLGIRGSQFEN